jgi:cytochrome c6
MGDIILRVLKWGMRLNTFRRVAAHVVFWICASFPGVFPYMAFADDVGNGQKLYMIHCSGCHGADGISVMPGAPNLARLDLFSQSDQDLADMIRSGSDKMPPYLGVLNDQEILDVVSYLRILH